MYIERRDSFFYKKHMFAIKNFKNTESYEESKNYA